MGAGYLKKNPSFKHIRRESFAMDTEPASLPGAWAAVKYLTKKFFLQSAQTSRKIKNTRNPQKTCEEKFLI